MEKHTFYKNTPQTSISLIEISIAGVCIFASVLTLIINALDSLDLTINSTCTVSVAAFPGGVHQPEQIKKPNLSCTFTV